MNFFKSILPDKPYLGAESGWHWCLFLEAVAVAEVGEVREVKNNILDMSRKLRLTKSF